MRHFGAVARELGVVLPISFFERAGRAYFNSIAILDADGATLGLYRKSHIPNGPGYQEKTYFSPGDTGFRVWNTRFARIGVGICWDQWFPETARVMALMGAELFFFPTAIGSEPPPAPPVNSRDHWQRTQQGHAAANLTPLIAANRYGLERSLQNPAGAVHPLLRLLVHRRCHGREGQPRPARRAMRCSRTPSTSRPSGSCATTGSCSATAARSCTARCSHSTAQQPLKLRQRVRAAEGSAAVSLVPSTAP